MKRVVIVGSAGQDGRILQEQLKDTAEVVGIDRHVSQRHASWRTPVDVLDRTSVATLIREFRPNELYYLAAHHHAATDAQEDVPALVRVSLDAHVVGWANVLDALVSHAPDCRAFYASSSHVFGIPTSPMQDERTPLNPSGVYGVTKAAGMHIARLYRQRGMFAACGILYNHESRYRGSAFVSQQIRTAACEKRSVRLGRLDAVVDWGWAEDTVRAMRAMLALEVPDDYVVATGEPHTVREFARIAFTAVGLDWTEYVHEDRSLLQKQHVILVGDSRKLTAATGWRPTITFETMVKSLVASSGA